MKRLGRLFRWIIRWTFRAAVAFVLLSVVTVITYRFVPVPVSPLMLLRLSDQASEDKEMKIRKDWVDIEEISPYLIQAAVASEDQNFLNHYGFDFKAMERAYEQNKKGKKIKGGSTISQQTAKNVFLWPARSYVRKAFEAYFTLLIETFWPKERIMEVYLNVIEMGDGIYGAEEASQKYFKKPASKLTKAEAALLVACFPNPRKWNPSKPTKYILKRQAAIMKQMDFIGKISFDENKEEKTDRKK